MDLFRGRYEAVRQAYTELKARVSADTVTKNNAIENANRRSLYSDIELLRMEIEEYLSLVHPQKDQPAESSSSSSSSKNGQSDPDPSAASALSTMASELETMSAQIELVFAERRNDTLALKIVNTVDASFRAMSLVLTLATMSVVVSPLAMLAKPISFMLARSVSESVACRGEVATRKNGVMGYAFRGIQRMLNARAHPMVLAKRMVGYVCLMSMGVVVTVHTDWEEDTEVATPTVSVHDRSNHGNGHGNGNGHGSANGSAEKEKDAGGAGTPSKDEASKISKKLGISSHSNSQDNASDKNTSVNSSRSGRDSGKSETQSQTEWPDNPFHSEHNQRSGSGFAQNVWTSAMYLRALAMTPYNAFVRAQYSRISEEGGDRFAAARLKGKPDLKAAGYLGLWPEIVLSKFADKTKAVQLIGGEAVNHKEGSLIHEDTPNGKTNSNSTADNNNNSGAAERKGLVKPSVMVLFSHASSLDAFVVSAAIPIWNHALGKSELFLIPFFSSLLAALGGVAIDRRNRGKAIRTMRRLTGQHFQPHAEQQKSLLASCNCADLTRDCKEATPITANEHGRATDGGAFQTISTSPSNSEAASSPTLVRPPVDCIAVAPEGTRSLSGLLMPFKKGPFYLWQQLPEDDGHERVIVPMIMYGAYDLYPPPNKPGGTYMTLPGNVYVRYLHPIYESDVHCDVLFDSNRKYLKEKEKGANGAANGLNGAAAATDKEKDKEAQAWARDRIAKVVRVRMLKAMKEGPRGMTASDPPPGAPLSWAQWRYCYAIMVGLTAVEIAINRELILLARDFFGLSAGRAFGLFALYTVTYTGAMYVLMEFGGDAYDSVRAGIGKAFGWLNPFRARRRGASNV